MTRKEEYRLVLSSMSQELSSIFVSSHNVLYSLKKLTLIGSSLVALMDDGSSGEAPPFGEVTVVEAEQRELRKGVRIRAIHSTD
jgi:hypothetical protein